MCLHDSHMWSIVTAMKNLDTKTKAILKDPKKRAAWVIYQLGLTGRSIASVARDNGVKRQTLGTALRSPYPHMEALLAEALGVPVIELFPERYDADGLPNRQRGARRKPADKCAKDSTEINPKRGKRS